MSAPSAGPLVSAPQCAALLLVLGAGAAVVLAWDPGGASGLAVFAAHAVLPAAGLAVVRRVGPGPAATLCLAAGVASLAAGAAALLPLGESRGLAAQAHGLLGALALAAGLAHAAPAALGGPRLRRAVGLLAALAAGLGPAVAWATLTGHGPVRYDADACYRFLTATTVEQSGEPGFPSALQVRGEPAACDGCHPQAHAGAAAHAHAQSGANPVYRRALAGFTRRRGQGAARWCQGCHSPGSLRDPTGEGTGGVDCLACHGVTQVRGLFGSAPLTLGGGAGGAAWEVALRPGRHARANGAGVLSAPALCAGCHRKHYGLAQTEFRWLAVLDPYREWLESEAGASVFTLAREPRGCASCHPAHGPAARTAPAVRLHLLARRAGRAEPIGALAAARPGEAVEVDVVVANSTGHGFPAWMPDMHSARLHVEVAAGNQGVLRSVPTATLAYELDARDAAGRPVAHGELDRAVALTPARRIPAGEADVVRYAFRVPAGGVAGVRARLVRSPRVPGRGEAARVVGEATWHAGGPAPAPAWLEYGKALTGARSYAAGLRALREAAAARPGDPAVHLALGRLFLEEGDRLAAREAFQAAAAGAPEAAQAWEAVVLRRSGQPEAAARLLEPLARRRPGDPRLRFELGRAYMDLLRHGDAAREFRALLDADPLDAAGHYNLRLCLLRLNRFTEARREEALYNLLAPGGAPGAPAGPGERPLRVFPLRPAGGG